MKKPIAAPAAAEREAPPMPIPPHGGSFLLNEDANTLTHVRLQVLAPDTLEGSIEPPVKSDPEEAR